MAPLEVQPDGRIFVIDGMPEEPKIRETNQFMYPDEKKRVNAENYAYEKALASAPRILCADQEQAKRLIKEKYGHDLDEMNIHTSGYIYQVPVEWEVKEELDYIASGVTPFGSVSVNKKVAILKESPKERQEEQRFTIEDMRECWQASRDHEFYQCDPAQKKYYPNFNEWILTRNK